MPSLLEQSGALPNKQPRFGLLYISKTLTGLFTQRSALHDPSDVITEKYYGGRPDCLIDGLNIELTNKLTLARRPGASFFSTTTYPTIPDRAYSFKLTNNTIQVLIDCGTTPIFSVTSISASVGGSAIYQGVFTGGDSNAFVGMTFSISNSFFSQNVGTFICLASTATTLTLANPNAVADSLTGFAVSAGAIWLDNQDGTKTLIFAKSPG
ncbi:MAG TPA: hypothetical protein VGG71_16265, partial [Chitinophagaceae bacterium]